MKTKVKGVGVIREREIGREERGERIHLFSLYLDILFIYKKTYVHVINHTFTYKGELMRDHATGLCMECKAGEVGQILGLINDKDPSRRFDGYTDKAATLKKVER